MRKTPKITLQRETLRHLTRDRLREAAGAYSKPPQCPPPTVTCNPHNYTCSGPRCL